MKYIVLDAVLLHRFLQSQGPEISSFLSSVQLLSHLWFFATSESAACQASPSVLFSSVAQSCPTFCHPLDCSMPGLPVHHQHLEFTQTHVYWVGDVIQQSHPLLSPFPAFNLSQHQRLFHWVTSSHQVAKVLDVIFLF